MLKPLVGALAFAAVAMSGVVGQAEANTVWVFPYKGAPHAVPHGHAKQANTLLKQKKTVRAKARDNQVAAKEASVIAHHKPGYHDGLPRTPRSEESEALPGSIA